MKQKGFKISILALALAFVASVAAFFGLQVAANAADTVTVSGTNVFTASGEANVIAYEQKAEEADADSEFYTMFVLAYNDDAVSYRKNLAYRWYTDEGEGLFNMEIGFASTEFDRFVIKFESQQYEKSKDSKSANYVVFFPAEEGKVYVAVTDDKDAAYDEEAGYVALSAEKISIAFTDRLTEGRYAVRVFDGDGNAEEGVFVNVGGNYAKASTSSSNPVYPLSFYAEFSDEENSDRDPAKMVLYSLNGQSFVLSDVKYSETGDGYWYGGTVYDDTPPVLCLEQEITCFSLGGGIDFDYAVIDVLRTSPKATVNYYVLTYDLYKDGETDYEDEELFTEISSTDEVYLESDSDKYLPETGDDSVFGENLYADMLVKVYLKLTDSTSKGESCNVYLDRYVPDAYKINVNGCDFIAVAEDTLGATYNYDGVGEGEDYRSWDDIKADYQAKIDELSKNLSAGSSSYLYLPSAESLFADNATAYTDLTFGIYYYHNSQQSNTGITSSNLAINLTQYGDYTFTIYATDAAGNSMYYIDENGETVEFEAGEIWDMYADEDDEGLADYLPWFNFRVGYTGVKFEETPGLQSTAYVETPYTPGSFSINGISGTYSTVYRLFIFDRAGYYADNGANLSYEEFVKAMDGLFDDPETRVYFTEIPALDSMEETDPEYELYADYAWSNTSMTFTPQDANAFYMIRAEVTDNVYQTDPVACNMGIVASVKAQTIKGESDWLKNNVASVVLLAVAGAALIGIILLLVIRPKDNGDIDVQFEKSEKAKNKKNK